MLVYTTIRNTKSRSRSLGQKNWYWRKGPVRMNTHVKYESPNSYCFQNVDQSKKNMVLTERSCHKGMYMWNIKTLPLWVQKLWSRLNFSKCILKVKIILFKTNIKVTRSLWKGIVTRNTHVKCESPTSYGLKHMTKVLWHITLPI